MRCVVNYKSFLHWDLVYSVLTTWPNKHSTFNQCTIISQWSQHFLTNRWVRVHSNRNALILCNILPLIWGLTWMGLHRIAHIHLYSKTTLWPSFQVRFTIKVNGLRFRTTHTPHSAGLSTVFVSGKGYCQLIAWMQLLAFSTVLCSSIGFLVQVHRHNCTTMEKHLETLCC